jgi:hypothetical protein
MIGIGLHSMIPEKWSENHYTNCSNLLDIIYTGVEAQPFSIKVRSNTMGIIT